MDIESYPDFQNRTNAELARNYRRLARTDFRQMIGLGACAAAVGTGALLTPLMEQSRQGVVYAAAFGSVAVILGQATHDLLQVYKNDQQVAESYENMSRPGHPEA